jgi:RNA polymerase sigma-70 factor (ECF subfamily)
MNAMAHALAAAAAGEPAERLAALFDSHYSRLYSLARRLAGRADEAEDLVQETFLRAARAHVPLGPTQEEAWLVRVLVNIRRDQWRRAAVRDRHAPAMVSPRSTSSGEAAFLARSTVWRALEALPPRRRAVVIMHELEELPIWKIAALLGIRGVTARWHLSKGRRQLADVLGAHRGEGR